MCGKEFDHLKGMKKMMRKRNIHEERERERKKEGRKEREKNGKVQLEFDFDRRHKNLHRRIAQSKLSVSSWWPK